MDLILNELEAFPEIESFILLNMLTNEERRVTNADLIRAFPDEETRLKIKGGRHKVWYLYEASPAFQQLV
ncbi:hypothetical protein Acj9p110 [Acinetobacter phage Acj9]|uniref:Uncharacterized protein 45.2 n=1 Tax=Acinetobacter phage Acj9 TaxID=760939 RepID=E5EPP4_9CAUD|nr:hypothetical protein Acj9p110 [Acinetobacter phage Acj9]ADG60010.1 hypothetical protein Acj9p110 [Acinetobacter phage Acj9]